MKIKQVIDNDLCISCGLCASLDNLQLKENKKGKLVPNKNGNFSELSNAVCPGKGYDIKSLSVSKQKNDYFLGAYEQAFAGYSNDEDFGIRASSGALIPTIALFLMENDYCDGVVTTSFSYGSAGPRPKTFIAYSKNDLIEAQGSKYCPTSTCDVIRECEESGKRFVFIGTPCQVAGIRSLQKESKEFKVTFPFLFTNFCGGYRDFRDLDHLIIAKAKMQPKEVNYFQHRGDGQPGYLKISDGNSTYMYPYPKYGKYSVVPKHKRCELCIDATGETADISFGDAWLPKYEGSSQAWSIMMIRNEKLLKIVEQLVKKKLIEIEGISKEEIILSQKHNLESKLVRQHKRYQVNKLFLQKVPIWNKELVKGKGSILQELKILMSKQYLELKYRANALLKKS